MFDDTSTAGAGRIPSPKIHAENLLIPRHADADATLEGAMHQEMQISDPTRA